MSHVTVVGYYGDDPWLTVENYNQMARIVERVVVEEFKLKLDEVTWVATAGTWCSHLPVTLWHKWANGNETKGKLVLPFEWEEFVNARPGPSQSIAGRVNGSHALMLKRLQSVNSKLDLRRMVEGGCQVIAASTKNQQYNMINDIVNYVIWMPRTDSDTNFHQGCTLFDQARGAKSCVPLDRFIAELKKP